MALNFLNNGYFGGKLGIGEQSPSAKLQITTPFASSPSDCIFLFTNGSNTPGGGSEITFGSSTSATPVNYNAKIQVLRSALDDGSSDMRFLTTHVATATFPDTKMIIKSDGNVGIGTTSPAARLEVLGTNNDEVLRIVRGNINSQYLAIRGYQVLSQGNHMLLSADNAKEVWIGHASNTQELVINTSGNVGIGTTSPENKLHVQQSALYTGIQSTAGIRIKSDGASAIGNYHGTIALSRGTGSVAISAVQESTDSDIMGMAFFTHPSSTGGDAAVEQMRIDQNGNVGIGETSPSSKLEVRSEAATHKLVSLNRAASVTAAMYLGNDSSNNAIISSNYSDLIFGRDQSSTLSEWMRIKRDGNVGIGTTSPGAKLDVAGTGNFTGLVSGITPVAAANFVTKAYVDGSGGGTGPFLPLAGGTMTGVAGVVFPDAFKLNLGTGSDLQISHDGFDSYINNINSSLNIRNSQNDGDIYFQSDNGSGGIATYFYLDGSLVNGTSIKGATRFPDSSKIYMGDSADLEIYHDGSNSYITDTGTGSLFIQGSDIFIKTNLTENAIFAQGNGKVELFHNNITKFETTSTGVSVTGIASATTFSGDLNGTINTATTGVTQANAINNTTIATTAYVTNKIGEIPAGLAFEGTWDARTVAEGGAGTPPSASPLNGQFWIVSIDGSQNLSGITDWKVGDWAIYVDNGAGTDGWQKVDNSSVLDGSGTGNQSAKWAGSGTSNTLTNGSIEDEGTILNAIRINSTTTTTKNYIGMGMDSTNNQRLSLAEADSNGSHIRMVNSRSGGGYFVVGVGDTNSSSNIVPPGGMFFYNGATRMVINSSGNVGIGTTSPDAKLEVSSTALVSGDARYELLITEDNTASAGRGGGLAFTRQGIIYGGIKTLQNTANDDNTSMYFQTRGGGTVSNRMTIDENGNVGIGTTSPRGKLDIVGNTDDDTDFLTIQDNDPSAGSHRPSIRFRSDTAQIGQILGLDNSMRFSVGTTEDSLLEIASGGNVGIGNTSPGYKLTVEGAIAVQDAQNLWLRGGRVGFENTALNNAAYIYNIGASGSSKLNIADTLYVIEAGNVGIGTTNPTHLLNLSESDSNSVQLVIDNTNTTDAGTETSEIRFRHYRSYVPGQNDAGEIIVGKEQAWDQTDHRDSYMSFGTRKGSDAVVEKMRIDSAGMVGIGIIPGNGFGLARLSLGTGAVANEIIAFASASGGNAELRNTSSTGTFTFTNSDGSSEKMRIAANGNVGIGTTSPGYKLSVDDDTVTTVPKTLLQFDAGSIADNGGYNIDFRVSSNNTADRFVSRIRGIRESTGALSQLSFWTESGSALEQRMTIRASGKVGIGTTTPSEKLEVYNAQGADDVSGIRNSAFRPHLTLQDLSTNSNDWQVWADGGVLSFLTGDVSAVNKLTTERMRIDTAGNVMIGNTNASAKLDIRQDTGYALRTENASGSTFRVEADTGNIEAAGSVKMGDDTDTASATKVGTMRYRTGTEYVEVTGTELITNGDFASSTDWVLKNSASINNGTGVATVPGAGALGSTNGNWSLSQASVFAVSTLYRVRFQARRDAGTASEMYVGQSYNLIFNQVLTTAWVEHEVVFTSTSNAGWSDLSFGGVVGTTSEVKEVSVMEVTAEDASYADMCMQTGASEYEWVNIVRNTY